MTASPLIIPVQRWFTISGGAALAGGFVYTYAAGTLTPKATYTDFSGTTPHTNPIVLDSSGSASIWLDGNYKINVEDANHVQQPDWPQDNIASSSSAGSNNYAVATGSANSYILTPTPAIVAYQAGTTFNVLINATSTGPSTINVSGLGAQAIRRNGTVPLSGGELVLGSIYEIIYDGTNFQLQNPTAPIEITYGFQAVAPWGKLTMDGSTIASGSGGTYNGAQYTRVYAYLWNNVSNSFAPVSTGRGVSAAADFAANKTITIPTGADMSAYGIGALLTSAGATGGAATVAAAGTNVVTMNPTTLTASQIPTLSYNIQTSNVVNNLPGVAQGDNTTGPLSSGGLISTNAGGGSFTPTGTSAFTGSLTSVVHPVRGVYWYISY